MSIIIWLFLALHQHNVLSTTLQYIICALKWEKHVKIDMPCHEGRCNSMWDLIFRIEIWVLKLTKKSVDQEKYLKHSQWKTSKTMLVHFSCLRSTHIIMNCMHKYSFYACKILFTLSLQNLANILFMVAHCKFHTLCLTLKND